MTEKKKMIVVRFPGNPRSFTFELPLHHCPVLHHGDIVVAPSDRGLDFGYVNSFMFEKESVDVSERLLRKATIGDLKTRDLLQQRAREIRPEVEDVLQRHEETKKMSLSHIVLTQFGKKIVLYYTASDRIDFRAALKELTSLFHLPVEFRQISQQDRLLALGSVTSFGEEVTKYMLDLD